MEGWMEGGREGGRCKNKAAFAPQGRLHRRAASAASARSTKRLYIRTVCANLDSLRILRPYFCKIVDRLTVCAIDRHRIRSGAYFRASRKRNAMRRDATDSALSEPRALRKRDRPKLLSPTRRTSAILLWTSAILLWSSVILLWTSAILLWTSAILLWTSAILLWTSAIVLWTSAILLWTSATVDQRHVDHPKP